MDNQEEKENQEPQEPPAKREMPEKMVHQDPQEHLEVHQRPSLRSTDLQDHPDLQELQDHLVRLVT